MKKRKNAAIHNLRLVIFESAITSGVISMSIMTPFFYSIGMDNARISLSQALFTVVVLLLNLPMGWLADRLSRKWANVIGDFGVAIGFLLYSTVNSFASAVFCECWLGVFLSISQGVDFALLKHFSGKIDPSEEFSRCETARLTFWQHLCTLILVMLGGPLGAIDFRLAIALSSVPSLIGGTISLFIKDDSEKLQQAHSNPFKDMLSIVRTAFRDSRLSIRLFAYAVGREMTHGIIWALTPMLLLVGVPLSVVSIAWAIDGLMRIIGTRLAARYATRLSASRIFMVPLVLMTISMSILSIQLNLWTIGFYLLMGIVCGWTGPTLTSLVQEQAPPAIQTTIMSLAKVMCQLLYIPASLLIGWAADFQLRYAALVTLAIFLPLGLLILQRLRRE